MDLEKHFPYPFRLFIGKRRQVLRWCRWKFKNTLLHIPKLLSLQIRWCVWKCVFFIVQLGQQWNAEQKHFMNSTIWRRFSFGRTSTTSLLKESRDEAEFSERLKGVNREWVYREWVERIYMTGYKMRETRFISWWKNWTFIYTVEQQVWIIENR